MRSPGNADDHDDDLFDGIPAGAMLKSHARAGFDVHDTRHRVEPVARGGMASYGGGDDGDDEDNEGARPPPTTTLTTTGLMEYRVGGPQIQRQSGCLFSLVLIGNFIFVLSIFPGGAAGTPEFDKIKQ